MAIQIAIISENVVFDTDNKNLNNFNLENRMYLHAYSFIAEDLDIEFNANPSTEFKKMLKNDE